MITHTKGNIFESGCQVLINPTNCVGVMGVGLALQFKTRYPHMFETWREDRKCDKHRIGVVKLYKIDSLFESSQFMCHFPTKYNWRENSELKWVQLAFEHLAYFIIKLKIKSIAIPPIGCDLGELKWSEVHQVILDFCDLFPEVDFQIFVPENI